MNNRLKFSALALIAALATLAWSFTPLRLTSAPQADVALPTSHPPAGMSLSALPTGHLDSRAAFAFRGGAFTEPRVFSLTAVLVRHPKGDLLFDTGAGRHAAEHFAATPWVMHELSKLSTDTSAADQLAAAHYDTGKLAIVPTHAHWDHISGLPDFPGVPVWLNADEEAFIQTGGLATELARGFGKLPIHRYAFTNTPYLGFARSLDVWGDGSVVLVPAPGHTPGSVIVFVTLPSGQRYGLVGDMVWQADGIERPAERPWATRVIVDNDAAALRAAISHVAGLRERFPRITWLPAHDARAMGKLPVFPAVAR